MTSYLITTTLPTCVTCTLLKLGVALCAQLNTVHPVQYMGHIYFRTSKSKPPCGSLGLSPNQSANKLDLLSCLFEATGVGSESMWSEHSSFLSSQKFQMGSILGHDLTVVIKAAQFFSKFKSGFKLISFERFTTNIVTARHIKYVTAFINNLHSKFYEGVVTGKYMPGKILRIFRVSAIFFPAINFPSHNLTCHYIPE